MFDNNNGNFNNNINTNNLFNVNNEYNNINEIVSTEKGDIPPKLEPIKNLSDATNSSAPTMDVLSPMNIMPESFSNSIDKLDAYENGSNFQNIPSQEQNNYVQPNSLMQNDYSLGQSNILNTQENILQQNNNISFGVPNSNGISLFDSAIQNENSLGQNNNVSSDLLNNNISLVAPMGENQSTDLNQENVNELNNSLLNSSFDTLSDFGSSLNLGLDKEPEIPNLNVNFDSNKLDTTSQSIIQEELQIPKQSEDYTILQNKIEEPQLDLGISNEFDKDFDTLDILDIEDTPLDTNDNVDTINSSDDEDGNESILITNVEKIKELISEIKNTGVEISLEEFDFENMYQLIIKINK